MNYAYKLHCRLIKQGLDQDPLSVKPILLSCVANAQAALSYSLSIFFSLPSPDTFSWNTIIRAHANANSFSEAVSLFGKMRQRHVSPDHYTLPFVLKACGHLVIPKTGQQIQSLSAKLGLDDDIFVQNALIGMYSNCGLVEPAQKSFAEMPQPDIVSWSTLISCYVNNGLSEVALAAFREMQMVTEIRPDEIMIVSVVSAVSSLGALELGKWLHFFIIKNGFGLRVSVGTALIVMYSKCGSIDMSIRVFDAMPERNVFTWTALIDGCAVHGRSEEALEAFNKMQELGFRPDYITFIGLLSACSHKGLLEEGRKIFSSMKRDYDIDPGFEHYGCMVDLLGRAGLVKEAYEFIEKMPINPNSVIWRTLLGACVNHRNLDMAEQVKKRISELDPYHDGDYVLISNAYGGMGRWVERAEVRSLMQYKGIGKRPGCSLIEVGPVIHEFAAGDDSHPSSVAIKEMLGLILERLRVVGYAPDTSNVLFDVNDEEKEQTLSYHSEKLALAFAFLCFDPESSIRIVKNIRICGDCHYFMKLVSNTFQRGIIIRDRSRFHHFRGGLCSCGDYW
ncbi:pentatricopeptide repeat-containing protein At5g48910-like [Aristolochia californica]|uniref:pentatricopeptide repeat-containing protein At5g48910-like n=1 Tax=Aristolochia californica TaxID=171875 RepID=UPI0035D8C669